MTRPPVPSGPPCGKRATSRRLVGWGLPREGAPARAHRQHQPLLDPEGAIRCTARCTCSTWTSPAASATASPTRSCAATRWWWPRRRGAAWA